MIAIDFQPFVLQELPPDLRDIPSPGDGEVSLWHGRIDSFVPSFSEEFLRSLNAEERQRMGRYFFERDQHQFLISRGLLRLLLGRYLSIDASRVVLGSEKFGKPFLKSRPIRFNVAHSENYILLGFSMDREIGVDLEKFLPDTNRMLPLVKSICSPREREMVSNLSPHEAELALTRLWTAKEACLKALGNGLQLAPDSIEIESSFIRGKAYESRVKGLPLNETVSIHALPELEAGIGFSAALAIAEVS